MCPKWSVLVSVPDVHIFLFYPVTKNKAETDVGKAIFRASLICRVVLHRVAQTPVVCLVIDKKKNGHANGDTGLQIITVEPIITNGLYLL